MPTEKPLIVSKAGPLVRLELLSDAVFAIAITLLVVDLKLPESATDATVLTVLAMLKYKFFAYLLSFFVIALQWVDHHTMLGHVQRCDRRLPWVNFLFLLCIAFVPFPALLLGRFPGDPVAVVFYSSVITLTVFARTLLWWYITHQRRLVVDSLPDKGIRAIMVVDVVALSACILLTAIASISPRIALYLWILFGLGSLSVRLYNWSRIADAAL